MFSEQKMSHCKYVTFRMKHFEQHIATDGQLRLYILNILQISNFVRQNFYHQCKTDERVRFLWKNIQG